MMVMQQMVQLQLIFSLVYRLVGGINMHFRVDFCCCCFHCMLRVAAHDYIALNERDFTISMTGRDGNNKWWRLSQHINNIQLLTQCWKKRAHTYTHINTPMSVIYHRTLMPFLFCPMLYVWTHLLLSQFQDLLWTSHHWMPIGKKIIGIEIKSENLESKNPFAVNSENEY